MHGSVFMIYPEILKVIYSKLLNIWHSFSSWYLIGRRL